MNLRRLLFGLTMLLLLAGCGKRVPPWGTVTGVVTQEGKPLPTTLIMFSNREAGVEIVTVTNANGKFAMDTAK